MSFAGRFTDAHCQANCATWSPGYRGRRSAPAVSMLPARDHARFALITSPQPRLKRTPTLWLAMPVSSPASSGSHPRRRSPRDGAPCDLTWRKCRRRRFRLSAPKSGSRARLEHEDPGRAAPLRRHALACPKLRHFKKKRRPYGSCLAKPTGAPDAFAPCPN
jgi:hypothetical protein